MKKYAVFLVISFLSIAAIAQPGDAEIRQIPMSKGAIATKFTSEKGTIHTTITEKWYMRTLESKWNTDFPEIKRWERTEYRYNYNGGKWVFYKSYLNSSWFDGIPNPEESEIVKLLEASKVGYQNAVIEKPVFKLAAEPKWLWHTYNSVEFMVEAIHFEKTNHTEVAKKKTIFPVRLYRDNGEGKHDPNTKKYYKNNPWLAVNKPIISTSYSKDEILETRNYTSEEADKIKTMNEIVAESEAQKRFSSLGAISIPAFQTDKEAIVWIHNILRDGDKDKIEMMLLSMLSSYNFEKGSSVLLNESGKNLLDNLKKVASNYSTLYCEFPTIKHEQENMMQFYDRENQSHARIALDVENGKFKISDIDCYFEPPADKISNCKAAGETNCGKPINTTAPAKLPKFLPNDLVTVNWNGQGKDFYNGKIIKVDSFNENRYFVEFEKIQSAWIEAKFINKRN